MRYHVLACDYDGTLAHDGHVDRPILAALERLLATGRKLVLVTGRELDDLLRVFPEVQLCARVVAENGALLYDPATKQEKVLCQPPPDEFVRLLCERGVRPVSTGRVIVATLHPHETTVLQTIRDLGLELQVIFNKDAVMVLPSGVNKATGLAAALAELGLSPHEAVGVGDAENDHAFLSLCECSVAVANALPAIKEDADLVTQGDHGKGVVELIERLVADDLSTLEGRLTRHHLLLGHDEHGTEVRLAAYGQNVLIAGPSGSGKSTAATSFLERLLEHRYQFCILDPEGDYENLEGAVTLGTHEHGPSHDEVLQMLGTSLANVVVNLVGLPLADRPPFFHALLPHLQEMRARMGRPHWLILDEAHHLLPPSWEAGSLFPGEPKRTLFITVHPDQMSPAALGSVDMVLAVGQSPEVTIGMFHQALGEPPPKLGPIKLEAGEVFLWSRSEKSGRRVSLVLSRRESRRHARKYAEGELPPDRSFYFRGPHGKLNLRAQNLILFMQLADGVDDETWTYHLRQGGYSRWFREAIKDDGLAEQAAEIEQRTDLSPAQSRALLRCAIEQSYTLPASSASLLPGNEDFKRP
jgi:hydroxymethylpyrimidine pyrophosphatase-like HAD family hydrolase